MAGNHDHYNNGIADFRALIHDTKPYQFVDGNIAWFFISDEKHSREGNMLDDSFQWLRENMATQQDKIIIVCSHQVPANTVRQSDRDVFCLHPKEAVEDLLKSYPIDLWMFGHEHHSPYSKESFVRKANTTFINIASMNHVYGTGASGSFVLELKTGAKEIVARRRHHDKAEFNAEFEVRVPLRQEISGII